MSFAHLVYLHQTFIKQDRKVISSKVKKRPYLRDSLIQTAAFKLWQTYRKHEAESLITEQPLQFS